MNKILVEILSEVIMPIFHLVMMLFLAITVYDFYNDKNSIDHLASTLHMSKVSYSYLDAFEILICYSGIYVLIIGPLSALIEIYINSVKIRERIEK